MVINNIICRASLAYNVTLYMVTANKREANITIIGMSFSSITPYTQKSVFLFNNWRETLNTAVTYTYFISGNKQAYQHWINKTSLYVSIWRLYTLKELTVNI